jgi:acid phosphatase type 7
MLTGHGAIDDIMLYSQTLIRLIILLVLIMATIISFIVDKKRKIVVSIITLLISFISLAISLYFAYFVILPKYIHQGEVPSANILKSSQQERAFHFAAAGDAHIGNKASRTDLTVKMINHMAEDRYDAFFLLGDLVDLGFDYNLWVKSFKTMEPLNKVMPICYVPGNHDTMFGGDEFFDHYSKPDKSNDMWRRIDIGNIHFLILDIEWVSQTYTQKQETWLKKQLEEIPGKDWCIVMSHTFYYCSGRYKDGWDWYDNDRLIKKISPLFEKYGVDLVLSGHMHQMEILQKNGVTYVVMGSFGGNLDSGRNYISPASIWYKSMQYGFADVFINGANAELKVRDTDNNIIYSIKLNNRQE